MYLHPFLSALYCAHKKRRTLWHKQYPYRLSASQRKGVGKRASTRLQCARVRTYTIPGCPRARRPLPALVLGAQSLARHPRTSRAAVVMAEALGIPDAFLYPDAPARRAESADAGAAPMSAVA